MCGIAGLFAAGGGQLAGDPAAAAQRMADALAHRGPDGAGAWGDAGASIGLGHRRLSIIDLSSAGAQPMHSADGRFVISYNGEVYNFRELRRELEADGHTFRGTSDTEVMLAAFVQWGLEKAVGRFVGMFAFAVFDRTERVLHLVRDRLGIKPLYWTMAGGTLLFGSELRALMAHPAFRPEVDRDAVSAFLRYSYVPTPASIFRGVHKLPPGTILSMAAGGQPTLTPYWRLREVVSRPSPVGISADEAEGTLYTLLREAVRGRMIADVPIGAFLSGGVDSATVVALMQSCSDTPVRTFTIGFREAAYDESPYAREIARHLGTQHTEVSLGAEDALALVGDIAEWFDEPFADSSQLPTFLVSRMTRQHVTVALSGDGGDELFGGYPRYETLEKTWRGVHRVPRPLRRLAGRSLSLVPDAMLRAGARVMLDSGRGERIGEKARRLAAAMAAPSGDAAAAALDMVGIDEPDLVLGNTAMLAPQRLEGLEAYLPDLGSRMQAQDLVTYLPDDILTKVDRCSMAFALEARVPLLDHRVVEFVWSLPRPIRRAGQPKSLLKSVLARYAPLSMFERPKRGFSVPLNQWLAGPLREWAEDLLSPAKVANEGLLNADAVQSLWQRHLSNREQNATGLWNILMLRAWSERWLKSPPGQGQTP
jgi:asparagine synthase (glutamine-hydrolysing)